MLLNMDDASKSIHMHACIFHLRVLFSVRALHSCSCFFLTRPKYSLLAHYNKPYA
jgi:hypothetical protein